MNPKHIHTPLSTRARCPVCREPVYSLAGVHPQCAVHQSDPPKGKRGQVVDDESASTEVDSTPAVPVVAPKPAVAVKNAGRRNP
jgi:hypothetical protein